MTEWHTALHCKQNITLRLSFTDGAINTGGITPAQYRTSNLAIQDLIESSEEFKSGKIKLLKTYKTAQKLATAKTVKTATKADTVTETPVTPIAEATTAEESPAETATDADGLIAVEVSDIESDGKQYLVKECGVPSKKLLSVAAVLAEAKANGIKFVVKE